MHFNRTEARTGALWENRYYSSVITEEQYMWRAAQYICLNPVYAGIVSNPCDFQWSSAKDLIHGEMNGIPLEDWIDEKQRPDFVQMVLNPAEISSIQDAYKRGLPYASTIALDRLEKELGVKLLPDNRDGPENPAGSTDRPQFLEF